MERARSVPVASNPFYSDRVRAECFLESTRPRDDLPTGLDDENMDPLQVSPSGMAEQSSQAMSGKGRGGGATGEFVPRRPVESLGNELKTEGTMPMGDAGKTMGRVMRPSGSGELKHGVDGFQRALEGELVDFLRKQNSELLSELSYLRGKLEKGSMGKSGTGMESSPCSAVGDSTDSSTGFVGSFQPERHGRHGSRTPRSKVRDAAVSPEKKDVRRYTPNGTKVPDGPPPETKDPLPPVPPFPVAPVVDQGGDGMNGSFSSELYDTCESKRGMKNGDLTWKPQHAQGEGCDVLSPTEAKQVWLEREVRSLKSALDRVSHPMLQQSEYWNAGFDNRISSSGFGQLTDTARVLNDRLAAFSGSGTDALQARAQHGLECLQHRAPASVHCASEVPQGVRAAYMHGEHLDRDRALREHGDLSGQARASSAVHGGHLQQVRASMAVHGGHLQQARASMAEHGGHRQQARAPMAVHGDLFEQARVSSAALHDGLCGHARADPLAAGVEFARDLHDCGRGDSCPLPQHGVGGGGVGDGMSKLPWASAIDSNQPKRSG